MKTALRRAGMIGALALVLAGCGGGNDDAAPASTYSLEELPAEAIGAYFVGTELGGLPLTDVLVPPAGSGSSVSFIYGECEPPPGEGRCAPPLEIQTWEICDRPPPHGTRPTEVRGALARFGMHSNALEIFSGAHTIVVFADTPRLRRRAALALRPAPSEEPPSGLRSPRSGPAGRGCG